MKKACIILAIVLSFSLVLSACGSDKPVSSPDAGGSTASSTTPSNKPDNSANSNSDALVPSDVPIYLSDMLEVGGTRIWYSTANIGKDEVVSAFVFENGKVKYYGNRSGLKLGDVAKMTDEEILVLLEEAERTWRAERFAANGISIIPEEVATVSPYPYSLNVITDSSGNNTVSEDIIYSDEIEKLVPRPPMTEDSPPMPERKAEDFFESRENKVQLSLTYRQGNVYEAIFGGFVGSHSERVFITRILGGETPSLLPTLDTPQHPGVIVD